MDGNSNKSANKLRIIKPKSYPSPFVWMVVHFNSSIIEVIAGKEIL